MKIIKFSAEVIEQNLITNASINLTITRGLPKNCRLVNARYNQDNRILELWFTEIEDCEEMSLEVTSQR